MTSSDFIEISAGGSGFRAERLFKAAISAFASLTRPSRNEAAQLEDLVLPLLPAMPAETLRFACAALSDCHEAPAGLVRRLADQPAGICAPLLIRSRVLSDVDLVTLIGRHGLSHALPIARRPGLNSDLLNVVQALVSVGDSASSIADAIRRETGDAPPLPTAAHSREENVREELRSMMTPASAATRRRAGGDIDWEVASRGYARLVSTAMTGHRALFQTAMADLLELDFGTACAVTDGVDGKLLVTALRALDLSCEQAFMLFALCHPGGFGDFETIRAFADRYGEIDVGHARARMTALRCETRPARRLSARPVANDPFAKLRDLTA